MNPNGLVAAPIDAEALSMDRLKGTRAYMTGWTHRNIPPALNSLPVGMAASAANRDRQACTVTMSDLPLP
ncbi:hypothetical protein SKAU_G00215230 [Synaphobranchus kaupii]|uniref:Uncharacterized protein n=1 Tax=Synaphobranchus kaupii TaxID=118154 RepID=A0A9Q1IVB9_SYNKA|nr:hypothetical protein SKAU_G00215230 [Synaphobranchus kaupii]